MDRYKNFLCCQVGLKGIKDLSEKQAVTIATTLSVFCVIYSKLSIFMFFAIIIISVVAYYALSWLFGRLNLKIFDQACQDKDWGPSS